MTTVMVWLLVTMSYGDRNIGDLRVLSMHPTAAACEQVQKNLPKSNYSNVYLTRCIQAEIVK